MTVRLKSRPAHNSLYISASCHLNLEKSLKKEYRWKKKRWRSMLHCVTYVLIGPPKSWPHAAGPSHWSGFVWVTSSLPPPAAGSPHWSSVVGGWLRLVSSYLQAGLEKCPLEKMTPLKGAENSRLTDIPLFSQVTSRPVHIFRTISSAD